MSIIPIKVIIILLMSSAYHSGDRNFSPRKFPPLKFPPLEVSTPGSFHPPVFLPHVKYAVDTNLFRLESSILTRAKRATNRNNVGGEHSLGEHTRVERSGGVYIKRTITQFAQSNPLRESLMSS